MSNIIKITNNPGLPKKINNYKLEEKCFETSNSEYYSAINTYINEKVLIRIIEKEHLNKSLQEISFIRNEIFISKYLNHKNILRLYEIIESKYYIFLVYDHFKGELITSFLKKRTKLSDKEILLILHGILNALLYLHESMKIGHLGLNLQNILIDNNCKVKIINFYKSCFYQDKTSIHWLWCSLLGIRLCHY